MARSKTVAPRTPVSKPREKVVRLRDEAVRGY